MRAKERSEALDAEKDFEEKDPLPHSLEYIPDSTGSTAIPYK